MRCQAKTTKGPRCTRLAWGDTPLCQQHIVSTYRAWMKACGFTKRLEFHVLENEPEIWVELE